MERTLAAVLVAATVSCGGSSGTGANPADLYLDEVLTLIQQNHIHRNEIDWTAYGSLHVRQDSPTVIRVQ
jgi:hypothetical protein